MDADKIRSLPVIGMDTQVGGGLIADVTCAQLAQVNFVLREMVAQLAELNSNISIHTALKDFDPRFS